MGRSVMTSSDAKAIVFIALTDDDHELWESFLEQVKWVVTEKWSSFYEDDFWPGREEHQILRNGLCNIIVCQYGDIASVNLVPRDDLWQFEPDVTPLAEKWCEQVADNFYKEFSEHFDCLARRGTMSNGVSAYERM